MLNFQQPQNTPLNVIDNLESQSDFPFLFSDIGRYYYQVRRILRRLAFKQTEAKHLSYSYQYQPSGSSSVQTKLYAFFLWRVAWERSLLFGQLPVYLSRNQLPIALLQWISWGMTGSKNTDSVIIQKCKQEIVLSYTRCLDLSEWMQQKGGYLTSPLVFQLIIPRLCILNRR